MQLCISFLRKNYNFCKILKKKTIKKKFSVKTISENNSKSDNCFAYSAIETNLKAIKEEEKLHKTFNYYCN